MFRIYYTAARDRKHYWDGESYSTDIDDAKLYHESEAAQLAEDKDCAYEKVHVTPVKRRVAVTLFILLQGNKVIDQAITPSYLYTDRLDVYAGFKIAIGYINEWDKKVVMGVVADVTPLRDAKNWRISSDIDGMYRLINAAGCPAALVVKRLDNLRAAKKFSNLTKLPMRVVLTASLCQQALPLAVNNVVEAFVPGHA